MIAKPLNEITYDDVHQLVDEQWPEGKTIDYKRAPYGNSDADKKELLKDVSSFANTEGGDIIIGVDEHEGLPTAIPGVTVADVDRERLRLEEIVRHGLDPRIDFAIHCVYKPENTAVIIIRVEESLVFPHRVVFHGKFGEFWARSSAGKYSMDTDELRRAFTLSATIYEQIKAFRRERVAQVSGGETPVPMQLSGLLILHLIPVASYRSRHFFDVANMPNLPAHFPTMATTGFSYRLNLDGYVTYSSSTHYTQFFRNGVVESVISDVVKQDKERGKLLLATYYERALLLTFPRLIDGYRQLAIQPPIWGFLTIDGAKGATIPSDFSRFMDHHEYIDRDCLMLPEFVIDDLDTNAGKLLRPVFDLVWNASGYERSLNFDAAGNWIAG